MSDHAYVCMCVCVFYDGLAASTGSSSPDVLKYCSILLLHMILYWIRHRITHGQMDVLPYP